MPKSILDDAVAYWRASDYIGQGNLLDGSGNSHDGVITGAKFLTPNAYAFVRFPGTSGNYISFADANAFDITGDIDIRCRVAADDWTPGSVKSFVAKYQAAGQRSFMFNLAATGELHFQWSTDGTATDSETSSTTPTVTDGDWLWVRVTLDVDNGSSNYDCKFYTGGSGLTPSWVQLGATQNGAATTSIYSSTSILELMSYAGGTSQTLAGKMSHAQIYDGIDGTCVFDWSAENPDTNEIYGRITDEGLRLLGAKGTDASSPNHSSLQITGDMELIAKLTLPSWQSGTQMVIEKNAFSSGEGYFLAIGSDGKLQMGVGRDGSTSVNIQSTEASGLSDGQTQWIKSVLHIGATEYEVSFWLGGDGPSPSWVQLGYTYVVAESIAVGTGTNLLVIGADNQAGASTLNGTVHRAIVVDGIGGTVVYDADFDAEDPGTTSFTESSVYGHTVTVNQPSKTGTLSGNVYDQPKGGMPYVYFPGVVGNYIGFADALAFDITGDIDIRARVALDDWTPGSDQMALVSKWQSNPGARSYQFTITQTTGLLSIEWSTDGTNSVGPETSSVAPSVSDGDWLWVRVTVDVDNGASGYDVKFYTGGSGLTPSWSQLGTTQTGVGTTSIYSGTSEIELGAYFTNGKPLAGKMSHAQIYDGIDGTLVFDWSANDPDANSSGQGTATGTLNRDTTDYPLSVVDRPLFLLDGVDDVITISDHADLDFGASESFTVVAVLRGDYTGLTTYLILNKRDATSLGWDLASYNAAVFVRIDDNTTAIEDFKAQPSPYQLFAAVGVRDVTNDEIEAYVDGVASGSPTTDTTTGTLENAGDLLIGAPTHGGNYLHGEFFGAAVFRRVLSQSEIMKAGYALRGVEAYATRNPPLITIRV